MTIHNPLPGIDTGLPAAKDRGPVIISDDELEAIAEALHRIKDLTDAGKVILGHVPVMIELEGNPALEGLFGIFAGIAHLAKTAAPPIERNI